MHTLINQITIQIAENSVKSIKNNGLTNNIKQGDNFSHMLNALDPNVDTANFAAIDAQSLPHVNTPISFQIGQNNLSTHAALPDVVNYNTNTDNAHADKQVVSSTSFTAYPANVNEPLNSHTQLNVSDKNTQNSINVQSGALVQPQALTTAVHANSQNYSNIPNNGSDESVATQLSKQNNNHISAAVSQSLLPANQINTNTQGTVYNALYNNQPIRENSNHSASSNNNFGAKSGKAEQNNIQLSDQVINRRTNQINTENNTVSIGERSHLLQDREYRSINSAANNSIATQVNPNQAGNNANQNSVIAVQDDIVITNNQELLSKVSERTSNESKPAVTYEVRYLSNNVQINKQLSERNGKEVSQISVQDADENIAPTKPIYNADQYIDVRRHQNNAINPALDTRVSDELSVNNKPDPANLSIQNKDTLDITPAVNRSIDTAQDIKSTANASVNTADKVLPGTLNASGETLVNKLSGLDTSASQLSAKSEINNGNEISNQITWAKINNANNVRISLTPEHLGALEIKIDQDTDGLNIQFTTQNSMAKDAIEAFMPRLKDMLEQQGLNLQNANVSQQGSDSQYDSYKQNADNMNIETDSVDNSLLSTSEALANIQSSSNQLLEVFA